jgi:hypothetical protein
MMGRSSASTDLERLPICDWKDELKMVDLLHHLAREASQQLRQIHQKHPVLTQAGGAVVAMAVLRLLFLFLWWLFFAPTPMYPISGILSCEGLAIQEGNISLEPLDVPGVASRTAHIVDGRFSLNTKNGVARGVEYVIRVEGFRKTGKVYPGVKPGEFSEEYEQFVLPEFNKVSLLRVRMTGECIREGLTIDVRGLAPRAPVRSHE